MLASLAAIAVIVVGGLLRAAPGRDRRGRARHPRARAGGGAPGRGRRPGATASCAATPSAIQRLDDLVLGQVVSGSIVRVKLWSKDGTILYSDEPALIGKRFALGDDERELFETGGAEAELSDLAQAREPLRAPAGQAARGAHRDPHAERHAGPVRDLPAVRLGERERRAAAARAGAAAARRPARADPAPAPARVVDGAAPAARAPRARAAAGQRGRGLVAGAPPHRRRPARRRRPGPRRASRSGSRRWPTSAERRGEHAEAAALRDATVDPAPGRARPADAARRDPSAEPRVRRASRWR